MLTNITHLLLSKIWHHEDTDGLHGVNQGENFNPVTLSISVEKINSYFTENFKWDCKLMLFGEENKCLGHI